MRCFIANCLLNPCKRGHMSASLLLPSSSSSARERKHKKITDQNKEGVSVHPGAYPQKDDFTYVWVPFYTRRQIAFATHFLIHILLCCTNRQLPANQLWRKKLQQQTHSSLQANLVQYARVTFTVLSTPTQILQAATELPLQSIHLFHVPLSDLGAREHPDTSSSGTQMSALIPNMRTLCMFGSFATTSTKTATVLRKNIGCL